MLANLVAIYLSCQRGCWCFILCNWKISSAAALQYTNVWDPIYCRVPYCWINPSTIHLWPNLFLKEKNNNLNVNMRGNMAQPNIWGRDCAYYESNSKKFLQHMHKLWPHIPKWHFKYFVLFKFLVKLVHYCIINNIHKKNSKCCNKYIKTIL